MKQLTDPVWLIPSTVCGEFDPPKKTPDDSLLIEQLYYQQIHEKHRQSDHIYTDGSKTGEEVGCAVLHKGVLDSKKRAKQT